MTVPVTISSNSKVALVIGAAGGIGTAVTASFRSSGMRVGALDITPQSISREDEDICRYVVDATDEDSISRTVDAVAERFSRLDYVVNLAGTVGEGPLVSTRLVDWHQVIATNLDSCFLLAKHSFRHLRAAHGTLVLCSSTNALDGGSKLSGAAYAAAKAAIINLTRYLAREWTSANVRVNCIVPGPVDTPMLRRLPAAELTALRKQLPTGRFATAAEIAAVVMYLCSAEAAAINGQALRIDGHSGLP